MDSQISASYNEIMTGSAPLRVTPAQKATLAYIAKMIPHYDFFGRPDEYEIKSFIITQYVPDNEISCTIGRYSLPYTRLYVYIETGRKNDENTLAGVFARKTRLFTIGPRGGLRDIHGKKAVPVSLFDLMNKWHYAL